MSNQLVVSAPCAKCPFRDDVPIFLHPDRRREIVDALINDQTFPCHEKVNYDTNDGEPDSFGAPMCAGAAKALLLSGGSTNLMRGAMRFGDWNPDEAEKRGASVWSLSEWPLVPEGETRDTYDPDYGWDQIETCSVVNPDCEAPAGYMGAGGGIVHGTVAAENWCEGCGEAFCDNCGGGNGDDGILCANCADDWLDNDDDE